MRGQWVGQFVVINWPYTDQTNSKRPPALVLDEPDGQGDLRLLKVTSRSHHEACIEVALTDLAEGQLRTTSYIRINHSMMLHHSQIKAVGVRLASHKLAEVHRALTLSNTRQFSRLQHGSFRPAADPERKPWQEGTAIP